MYFFDTFSRLWLNIMSFHKILLVFNKNWIEFKKSHLKAFIVCNSDFSFKFRWSNKFIKLVLYTCEMPLLLFAKKCRETLLNIYRMNVYICNAWIKSKIPFWHVRVLLSSKYPVLHKHNLRPRISLQTLCPGISSHWTSISHSS